MKKKKEEENSLDGVSLNRTSDFAREPHNQKERNQQTVPHKELQDTVGEKHKGP